MPFDLRAVTARELWKLQCRINRPLPLIAPRPERVRFIARGASCDLLAQAPPPATDLCVGITTYARSASCARLLRGLHAALTQAQRVDRTFIVVVRDTSAHDYREVIDVLEHAFAGRFALYEGESWLAKPGRYQTYQAIFDVVARLSPAMTFFLEDDVEVDATFVERGIALYEGIDDPEKAVLYLAKFDDDEPNGRWVHFPRRPVDGLPVHQTQWFDLHAFIAGPRFFDALDGRLFAPYRWRWVGNPQRSSGVSEQFTLRLQGRGHIFQTNATLAYHGQEPSVLNVEARQARSLNNFPAA